MAEVTNVFQQKSSIVSTERRLVKAMSTLDTYIKALEDLNSALNNKLREPSDQTTFEQFTLFTMVRNAMIDMMLTYWDWQAGFAHTVRPQFGSHDYMCGLITRLEFANTTTLKRPYNFTFGRGNPFLLPIHRSSECIPMKVTLKIAEAIREWASPPLKALVEAYEIMLSCLPAVNVAKMYPVEKWLMNRWIPAIQLEMSSSADPVPKVEASTPAKKKLATRIKSIRVAEKMFKKTVDGGADDDSMTSSRARKSGRSVGSRQGSSEEKGALRKSREKSPEKRVSGRKSPHEGADRLSDGRRSAKGYRGDANTSMVTSSGRKLPSPAQRNGTCSTRAVSPGISPTRTLSPGKTAIGTWPSRKSPGKPVMKGVRGSGRKENRPWSPLISREGTDDEKAENEDPGPLTTVAEEEEVDVLRLRKLLQSRTASAPSASPPARGTRSNGIRYLNDADELPSIVAVTAEKERIIQENIRAMRDKARAASAAANEGGAASGLLASAENSSSRSPLSARSPRDGSAPGLRSSGVSEDVNALPSIGPKSVVKETSFAPRQSAASTSLSFSPRGRLDSGGIVSPGRARTESLGTARSQIASSQATSRSKTAMSRGSDGLGNSLDDGTVPVATTMTRFKTITTKGMKEMIEQNNTTNLQ